MIVIASPRRFAIVFLVISLRLVQPFLDQFDVSHEFVARSDLKSVFAHIGVDYRTIYGLPTA